MSSSAVSGLANTTSSSSLSIQDFMQVLMTQLTYQDPMKPMDNQAFLAQIAQFTTLEQTQQLNTNLQSLVSLQSVQQSIGLIGHAVSVTTDNGPQTGTVTAISLEGSTPQYTIKTSTGTLSSITLNQITSIQ